VPLELGSKVTHVVLDKTGTLTSGRPRAVRAGLACPGGAAGKAWQKLLASCRQALGTGVAAGGCEPAAPTTWVQEAAGKEGATVALPGTEAAAERERLRAEAERALWWAVGSAEMSSEHPLAKALTEAAAAAVRAPLAKPAVFENTTGVGVRCMVLGCEVRVAAAGHLLADAAEHAALAEWVARAREDGSTVVAVAVDGVPLAGIALKDALAPHARACVAELHMGGAEVWMCTGDHRTAAELVARDCGISQMRVVAQALPGDKVATVKMLQAKAPSGRTGVVAMVGDGVNDAPALAAADLGVAIGAGHNVTVDAADIVLVRSDLRDLGAFFGLARRTLRTIWLNFLWAFAFNACALPVAAGAFWPYRVLMTPQIAVCLMLSSSLFVVLCSLTLRNYTFTTDKSSFEV